MASLVMCTASGEQHGLINTLTNAVPFTDFKHMEPNIKAKCEKQKKEDSRIVKAKLISKRGRQERLEKPYCKWAGDPIQVYRLIPGHVYDLPKGFVDEVNDIKVMKRSGLVSVDGKEINSGGAPLAADQEDEKEFQLVPATF